MRPNTSIDVYRSGAIDTVPKSEKKGSSPMVKDAAAIADMSYFGLVCDVWS